MRIILVFDEQKDIPNSVRFPIQIPTRTFSNCLSHKSPASGCPFKFRSRRSTGSSICLHDFGHLCRGRRIQKSGHSDFGIFQHYGRILQILLECTRILHQSVACSSQSGYLGITSITFAAVIWDADEPCSVKDALAPESFFCHVATEHRLCLCTSEIWAPAPHF